MSDDWEARLAARRAEKEAAKRSEGSASPITPPSIQEAQALSKAVPNQNAGEVEKDLPRQVEEADRELASLVRGIDILDAYSRWCGKMAPKVMAGQRESIMISCPTPGHQDSNPSAWINLDKQVWHCGGCGAGGDAIDLAAIHYNMPDYKQGNNGKEFNDLFRKVGEEFGWKYHKEDGYILALSPTRQEELAAEAERQVIEEWDEGDPEQGELIEVDFDDDDFKLKDKFGELPEVPWRELVQENTFLDYYMRQCVIDHAPESFHFWNGLIALGLAAGRNVRINEAHTTFPNLFVCHIGRTGLGKTLSTKALDKVISAAMPYDDAMPNPDGVNIINGVASGEALIKEFIGAPRGNMSLPMGNIKGIITYDELVDMITRGARQGSILKTKLLEFYDCKKEIGNKSVTGGKYKAINPYASLSTSIQPEVARTMFTKDDTSSGFLNRFIFITGKRKKPQAVNRVKQDFSAAILKLQQVFLWAKNPQPGISFDDPGRELDYSEEAEALWTDFHDNTIDPLVADGPAMVARAAVTMRKLIMLFAINSMEEHISRDSVERAIKLWDYVIAPLGLVSDTVQTSVGEELILDVLDLCQKMQKKVKSGVKYMTTAEILRHRKYAIKDINEAFDILCKANMLKKFTDPPRPAGRRGRWVSGVCYLPTTMESA